jgi:hypothetical protein
MAVTNFPFGVSSYGVPILGPGGGLLTTGNVWFVNSAGSGSADGQSPQTALRTVAAGVAAATAGDTVLVLPGHAETISTATSFGAMSKAVQIVGLGTGSLRPTFTYTAPTATIAVSAANVSFTNCIFVAGVGGADVAAAFTLTAAKNFTLDTCDFRDTSAILNFVSLVDTSAVSNDADGLTLAGTNWYGLTATATSTIIRMDGTNTRVSVLDGYFTQASVDDAAKLMPIATTKVVTNLRVLRNVFNFIDVSTAAAGILITTDTSTNSGIIAFNSVFAADATTEILVSASSGFKFNQNWYSAVADKSGYIVPVADS